MWAQSWTNIEPLVRPFKNKTAIDVTAKLVEQVKGDFSTLISAAGISNHKTIYSQPPTNARSHHSIHSIIHIK